MIYGKVNQIERSEICQTIKLLSRIHISEVSKWEHIHLC